MKRHHSILIIILETYFLLLLVFGQGLISCNKYEDERPYLQLKTTSFSVSPAIGDVSQLVIESNVMWKVTVLPAATDWIQVNKSAGLGNETLLITVVKENPANTSRTATIVIESVESNTHLRAQATVTQQLFNPQFIWRKTMGGQGYESFTGLCLAPDGGYLVVGGTDSDGTGMVRPGRGNQDLWAVRLNANGDTMWTRVLGGTSGDGAAAVAATAGGEFIIAGSTNSNNGDVWGQHGDFDAWVIKLKSNGDTAWTRTFGTAFFELAQSVAIGNDGSIFIAGTTYTITTLPDIFVLKLSGEGELRWEKKVGGSRHEEARSIVATGNGGAIVTGITYSSELPGFHGGSDALVECLDANGNSVWRKLLGGSLSDELYSLALTSGDGCVVAGAASSSNGDISINRGSKDAWVVKLRGDGGLEWSTTFGGTGYDEAYAVKMLPGGDCIIAGGTDSDNSFDIGPSNGRTDILVARISSSGLKVWTKLIGGSGHDVAGAIAINNDNTFTIAGQTASSDKDINTPLYGGSHDCWMVRMKEY